ISIGTIHNRLQSASSIASGINESQDLSGIDVGLQDEIFQGSQPVLAGVDAASTYCYLLQGVEKRDEDTWGWYLLESMKQGFAPEYTIADGGQGLRAGQKAVMPETRCHGDVFHMQRQFARVANSLSRQVKGATSRRRQLEQQIAKARLTHQVTRQMRSRLGHARQKEQKLISLARDLKTLLQWLCHDVFELAGPSLEIRQELFDFIATELQKLECKQHPAIRKLRKALRKQRDDLLAFAGVLDRKLTAIARSFNLPLQTVREVCLLFRKRPTSNPYWERWNQLQAQLSGQFHAVMEAVAEALKQTPRASSLVENLNSRLRNYFFLRRSLNDSYLSLLQFFLNHRRFMRSHVPERIGKSPRELLTGDAHTHWLEMLGFQRFQRA
ncbi:MAG: transposase, partial [Cyanobacteria bacterium J06597_1]